jgi:hypothetical protein
MCIYTYNRMMSLQGVPKARYGILQLVSTYQMSLRDMVEWMRVVLVKSIL